MYQEVQLLLGCVVMTGVAAGGSAHGWKGALAGGAFAVVFLAVIYALISLISWVGERRERRKTIGQTVDSE